MLRVILDDNNDIPVGGPVLGTGIDSAASAIRSVLSTQAGEWPYDLTFGVMWRGAVFGKFFDAAATRSLLAATVNTVPDIEPITAAQITIDTVSLADARQANITIDDVTVDDEQVDLDFTTVY